MTLDEWTKEARSELELFKEFWRGQNQQNPDNWILEMTAGEWDEQFLSYKAYRRPPEQDT